MIGGVLYKTEKLKKIKIIDKNIKNIFALDYLKNEKKSCIILSIWA